MTTPSTARKAGPYSGTGAQTSFPFTFKVFAASDVKVAVADSAGVETVLTMGAHYSVALNSNQETSPGGTITYPISGSPLPTGSVLSIIGDLPYDQPLDLPSGGNFSPLALENQLDRATIQIQQLKEQVDRSAKLPQTSTETPDTLVFNITRLAESADNLDAVASGLAAVNTVAAVAADVETVADNVADVAATGANIAAVVTVANDLNEPVSEIEVVAGSITSVNTVGSNIASVNAVAGNIANVNTVAAVAADVETVADNVADVTNFADVYYGPSATDPATRRDGSALQAGDLYFNTVGNALRAYSGTQWGASTAGTISVQRFSGTGAQTAFTLALAPASGNNTQVYIGGVYQQKDQYSLSGATLTFSSAPPAGTDNIEVVTIAPLALGTAGADMVAFKQAGTGAVDRTASEKLREFVSVKDFGAVGDGVTDDTAAINSALAYAHSVSLGAITNPYAQHNAGSMIVYLPPGKYITSGKLTVYESTGLVGAGRLSTVIQSSFNGNVIETPPPQNYNGYGMVFSDFQIVGDRTKTSQVGLGLLRPYQMCMRNVGVNSCGSDGIVARQALQCEWHNIEVMLCGGAGIRFTDGTDTWDTATTNNYPSNANMIFQVHCAFNDGPGIVHSKYSANGGVNGNIYHGGSSEYNYYSSPAGTGYNIEILDAPFMPSEFIDMWCEGPVKAHVYVNAGDISSPVRFTRFHHFGNGSGNYPERAVIVNKGSLLLDGAYGHGASYRSVTGSGGTSIAPFRLNKAGGVAIIQASNVRGSTISNNAFIEDENQNTTGLMTYARINNYNYEYGQKTFVSQFGDVYPAFQMEGQAYPSVYFRTWDPTNGSAPGWAFGSGSAAADTNLIRLGNGILGMGAGNSFQLDGASGATLRYANGTANGAVATTLGSVGPTGATAGNPQGWLRVNVGGVDRFLPYW